MSSISPVAADTATTTVVIYSGGMDSFTVLHRALREGLNVHVLSFDYGQRHARELDTARQVCASLGLPHQVVDIRAIRRPRFIPRLPPRVRRGYESCRGHRQLRAG